MIFSYILMTLLIISTLGKDCANITCSNVIDEVCGIAVLKNGTHKKQIYQNICLMRKKACELESVIEINQVANELCNISITTNITKNEEYLNESRRVEDFSIVGSYQSCNHTCPTFCTDTYDPACAQFWQKNMVTFTIRPMINHCHIDLYSCASGRNVTIKPLNVCFDKGSALQFMQNIAMMKSLKLFDNIPLNRRGIDVTVPDENSKNSLKKHLKEIVRRLFEKYHNKDDEPDQKT